MKTARYSIQSSPTGTRYALGASASLASALSRAARIRKDGVYAGAVVVDTETGVVE